MQLHFEGWGEAAQEGRHRMTSEKSRRGAGERRHEAARSLGDGWYVIEIAAAKLDLGPEALRARCRRASLNENGEIVARLGMGVIARKLGTSWRVFVPTPEVGQ